MILLADILVEPAKAAGINVPSDPDDYDPESCPHWHVFCSAQLGQSMPDWSAHWDNAKIVAAVPRRGLKRITIGGLCRRGFKIGPAK